MNLQPYLDFAVSAAYQAGKITLGYFNSGVKPEYKEENQVVTIADREAEQFVRASIEKVFPDHAFIGEEFGEGGRPDSSFRWMIDPIDGTISFVRGVPLYGVLIGLEIEGRAVIGAAYYPGLDEMIHAGAGMGAYLNGRRIRVSEVGDLAHACVVSSDFEKTFAKKPGLHEALKREKALFRTWGDAYGYALVASGRAEAALDPIMDVWDCSPYPVILKEAGGYFGSWNGEEGHSHGEGLACNAALLPRLMKLMRDG